ncbi:MAG: hypothetical protein WDO06_01080 [Actinomycetota bacterium]
MNSWIPGLLALSGAIFGVLLTHALTRRSNRADAKRNRLEDALKSVVLAIAAQNFATSVHVTGKPTSITALDTNEFHRRLWLKNNENVFVTLREAREKVGILVVDGISVGESWRRDIDMQDDLENIYRLLREALKLN